MSSLRQVAGQTRRAMESLQRRQPFWNNSLECMCLIASYDLFLRLKRLRYKPKLCINASETHCFVVCDGYILDVTATQITKKMPKVMVRKIGNLPNTRFRWVWEIGKLLSTEKAIHEHAREWPEEQQPLFITDRLGEKIAA